MCKKAFTSSSQKPRLNSHLFLLKNGSNGPQEGAEDSLARVTNTTVSENLQTLCQKGLQQKYVVAEGSSNRVICQNFPRSDPSNHDSSQMRSFRARHIAKNKSSSLANINGMQSFNTFTLNWV